MPAAKKKPADLGGDGMFPPHLEDLPGAGARDAGERVEYAEILRSICGATDDSQAVEQYDGTLGVTVAFVNAHERPVVQVQWNNNLAATFTNPGNVSGVRWGTGTLIGPDLVLTCGHLFDPDPNGWTIPRQNGTSTPLSPQQVATAMHVNLNYQVDSGGTLQAEQSFAITQLVEYRLGGLDMALFRVAGNPGDTFGWSEFGTTNAAVGDMLAIIGHPAGQPKRVEAGPATQVSGSTIRYADIDTLGGNSGSGILHSPSGRVVGVHTNGGCTATGGSNSGVAIAAIVAASPTLQGLTPSSATGLGLDLATALATDVTGTFLSADTAAASDTGIQDHIGTPIAQDLATSLAADTATPKIQDLVGTPLSQDLGTTLVSDAGTPKVQDTIGTPLVLDHGTALALDAGTPRLQDTIGTPVAADAMTLPTHDYTTTLQTDTHVAVDVGTPVAVDSGAADQPGTVTAADIGILQPGGTVINPVINPGLTGGLVGGQRPFVQAGPYISLGQDDTADTVLGAVLAELEALISTQTQVLASLQALYATLAGDAGLTGQG